MHDMYTVPVDARRHQTPQTEVTDARGLPYEYHTLLCCWTAAVTCRVLFVFFLTNQVTIGENKHILLIIQLSYDVHDKMYSTFSSFFSF